MDLTCTSRGLRITSGGIMIRNSNNADTAYAFVGAAGNGQGVVFQSRPKAGALKGHHKMIHRNWMNKMYVKLTKNGTVKYYKVTIGLNWAPQRLRLRVLVLSKLVEQSRPVIPTSGHGYGDSEFEHAKR